MTIQATQSFVTIFTHAVKLLLLTLFFVAFLTTAKADCRQDTIYKSTIENKITDPKTRIINQFNAQNKILESLEQEWNSSSKVYVNAFKSTYTYLSNGKLMGTLGEVWNFTGWKNYFKETNTYDASGNLITYLSQNWVTSWEDRTKIEYRYNATNQQISTITSSWNYFGNNTWDKRYKDSLVYNANQLKTEKYLYYYDETIKKWDPIKLGKYSYNGQNNVATIIELDWYMNKWDSAARTNISYNSDNQITQELTERWDNTNGLYVDSKTTYSYNLNKKLTQELAEEYNPVDKVWTNYNKLTYTYDGNANLISKSEFLFWDNSLKTFTLEEKEDYKCTNILSVNFLNNDVFKIYPNPANHTLSIESKEQLTKTEIYTINGIVISQKVEFTDAINTLELNNIENGLYFIKCYTTNGVYFQKILIQH